jgi:hypothetical protein
LM